MEKINEVVRQGCQLSPIISTRHTDDVIESDMQTDHNYGISRGNSRRFAEHQNTIAKCENLHEGKHKLSIAAEVYNSLAIILRHMGHLK